MGKEFVLVSQGIEIFRTKNQEEAIGIVQKENDKWFKYKQKCLDNHEDYADNYIDLEIEYEYEKELINTINNLITYAHYSNNEVYRENLIGKLVNRGYISLDALKIVDEYAYNYYLEYLEERKGEKENELK